MTDRDSNSKYCIIFLLIIWSIYSAIFYYAPHVGDDMAYGNAIPVFSGKFSGNEFIAWLYYNGRHWFFSNGRMANYLASGILYWVPQWLIAILNGFMMAMLGYMILKISGILKKSLSGSFIVLAFIYLCLPWWDSGLLTDVALNYTWSAVFGLMTAYWFIYGINSLRPFVVICLIIFSFFAGMMHEAMSVPLLAGFIIIYLRENKPSTYKEKELKRIRKSIILGFGLGCIEVLLSPGIWKRFFISADTHPDEPFFILFLKSDFLIIILVFLLLGLLLEKGWNLKKYDRPINLLILFCVASFCSAFFSGISGTVGRSGFFAQIYSLIAITLLLAKRKISFPKIINIIFPILLAGLMLFCLTEVMVWQIKRGKEFNRVLNLFKSSKDGTIYADYTDDREIPFYTLGITMGVPDTDDLHAIDMINFYEGKGKQYKVLPENLRQWNPEKTSFPYYIGKGWVEERDNSIIDIKSNNEENPTILKLMKKGETVFTVTPFKRSNKEYYFVQPIDLDHGDHWHEIGI